MDEKAALSSKFQQGRYAPGTALSKSKMFADKQLSRANTIAQHLFHELCGAQRGKGRGEFEEHDFIDAGGLEPSQLFCGRGEKHEIDLGG